MTREQYFSNLLPPRGKIDAVIDTDTFNEVDDQFALAYLLSLTDRVDVKAIYAAPFHNERSTGAEDGMEKSYSEIMKVLDFGGFDFDRQCVFKGSRAFMESEDTPVPSDACEDLAQRAMRYSPENPLYVVAIAAITDIASAILKNPAIAENIVVVWLGGHSIHECDNREFNMRQDIAAARVVFGCGVPLVQLPCRGVVSSFLTTGPELEYWLRGKNPLCDYLLDAVIDEVVPRVPAGAAWSRVIWDVTAVGWLINDDNRLMSWHLEHSPIPEYDHRYAFDNRRHFIASVDGIHRDALYTDLFRRLTKA